MPFDSLKFRYQWRPYQTRVLDAIEQHLDDRRLHVVAAPGAGKTTLGLEVFRKLKKRTLVLSPSRIIRDQWISRLADFCDSKNPQNLNWVSSSLDDPKTLTSVTYQALHSRVPGKAAENEDGDEEADEETTAVGASELKELIQKLREHNIEVIILDEAHHLRTEWWSALDKVCAELPGITLVSLTGTPPYDAEDHEWNKYEQLCGPIDEEISVPELVKAGTLCPHQDFIWAVPISSDEKQRLEEYDSRVSQVCDSLFNDKRFRHVTISHPWVTSTPAEQEIFKEPEIAVSILVFMKAKGIPLPQSTCSVLDIKDEDIPQLGRHWWQILIEAVLFSNTFAHSADDKIFIDQLKRQLKSSELLKNKELYLERSRRVEKSLALSASKIQAAIVIHKLEHRHRGNSLRQVIMTDYIRDEGLSTGLKTGEVNLGAWPVFKGLIAESAIPERIALLTGRLSIIHKSQLEPLLQLVEQDKVNRQKMTIDGDYLKITGPLNQLTAAFTKMLMHGDINTLIGTRSLLGEGWDAPAINSLVLASSVGSFMLTNQMRGRAIRIDKNAPDKISSIWHLVAIDTRHHSGLSDFYDLKRRFETFVGLSERNNTIESGFERLKTDFSYFSNRSGWIASNNRLMIRRYLKRLYLQKRWHDALTIDANARVLPSVNTPNVPKIRGYHVKNTLRHLLFQITNALASVFSIMASVRTNKASVYLVVLAAGFAGVLLYKLPKTIAIIRTLIFHLPVDGALKQIGIALREALCQSGLIETSIRRLKVITSRAYDGTFYLSLAGSTFYESSLFADCLGEILGPIDNPRYIILREGTVYGMQRDDYHTVPLRLGVKKETAQMFYKAWCKYVGPTEMIYTRTDEGKKLLLKAKMRAFSTLFAKQVKREDRWQ
jgi:superfamily II DNA or RNA helicase